MLHKYQLKNGMTSLFYTYDTAYSVTLSLNIKCGVISKTRRNNGITHLLEHMHFRRLNGMTQEQLYNKMDKIGGNLYGATYKEMMRFEIKVRPKYIFDAIDILENIVRADEWSVDETELEKRIIINEMQNGETDAEDIAHKIIWRNTPLSFPVAGTEKSLMSITPKDLSEYKRRIFSEGNVAAVITGKVTEDEIEKINSRLERLELNPYCPQKKYYPKSGNKLTFKRYGFPCAVMSFGINQAVSGSILTMLTSLIGGGQSSLLQRRVREESALTYDIYSYITNYSNIYRFNIFFSANESDMAQCIGEVFDLLYNIENDAICEEHKCSIVYYTDNLWFMLENTERLNGELSWEAFERDFPKSVEQRIEEYENISIDDISNAAKLIFKPENCSLTVLGEITPKTKAAVKDLFETRT